MFVPLRWKIVADMNGMQIPKKIEHTRVLNSIMLWPGLIGFRSDHAAVFLIVAMQ